jgi:hypothetical protein
MGDKYTVNLKFILDSESDIIVQASSIISLSDAGNLALGNAKNNLKNFIKQLSATVYITVSDQYTDNNITSTVTATASGSGRAYDPSRLTSVASHNYNVLTNAYNSAFQAAADNLSNSLGLINHVGYHYS